MSYWKDKTALVTGGSVGLGLCLARALVGQGARVAIAGREPARLNDAVAALELEADGSGSRARDPSGETIPAAVGIAADITQQEQVESLVQQAVLALGHLDMLVNCAGRSARGTAAATSPDHFRDLWELNFLAQVRCTQACLPHLLRTRGHVVNIGSLASKTAAPYMGGYAASKFPLAAFSQQLRVEMHEQGLHVLLVCPGPIRRDDAGRRYDEAKEVPAAAREPGAGVRLKLIDPDWLARRILAACQRRTPELVVPAKARLLFAIQQLWPSLGDWIVRRMTKR